MKPDQREFLNCQLKHEILREAFGVAFYRLHEHPGFDAIECSQAGIEHHLVAADDEDCPLDEFNGR